MPNVILNSSFEYDSNNDSIPDNWSKVNSGVDLSFGTDVDGTPHGSRYLRMVDQGGFGITSGVGVVQDNVSLPAAVGASAVVSIYALDESMPNANLEVVVQWHNNAHANLGELVLTITPGQMGYPPSWKRFSGTGVIPAGATHCQVYIQLRFTATSTINYVEVDAIQLEAGTTPTAYTPAPSEVGNDVYSSGQYLFNGVQLNNHQSTYDLIVEKVEGLFDIPIVKSSGDYEDAALHGGFAGQERIASRYITMDLILSAVDEKTYHEQLQLLRTALIPSSQEKLLWFKRTGQGGTDKKFVYCRPRRFGGFDSDYDSARGIGKGSAQLWCPDPAKYDWIPYRSNFTHFGNNTGYFDHTPQGNFRTLPVFEITGPTGAGVGVNLQRTLAAGAPVAVNRNFILSAAIPSGQTVRVDSRLRTVVNLTTGADWRQYVDDTSEWLDLLPGTQNYLAHINTVSSATNWTLLFTYNPAWL